MASSLSAKPISMLSIFRISLKYRTTGIEPPEPIITGSDANSSFSPAAAVAMKRLFSGTVVAALPAWPPKRGRQLSRILPAHQSTGNFRGRFGGQHGLGALAGVAAVNSIDLESRPRPQLFQNRSALLAGGNGEPHRLQKSGLGKFQSPPLLLDFGRKLIHAFIKTGNGYAAVAVVK